MNVFAIHLPPLRERRDDVLALSEAFLEEIGRSIGRPPAGISRDARDRLMDYHWPGNVRELRNILERAAILCEGGLITTAHLALTPPPAAPPPTRASGATGCAGTCRAEAPAGAQRRAAVGRARDDRAGLEGGKVQQVEGGQAAWTDAHPALRPAAAPRPRIECVPASCVFLSTLQSLTA